MSSSETGCVSALGGMYIPNSMVYVDGDSGFETLPILSNSKECIDTYFGDHGKLQRCFQCFSASGSRSLLWAAPPS